MFVSMLNRSLCTGICPIFELYGNGSQVERCPRQGSLVRVKAALLSVRGWHSMHISKLTAWS
jgi:hypothetical protein